MPKFITLVLITFLNEEYKNFEGNKLKHHCMFDSLPNPITRIFLKKKLSNS